MDEPELSRGVRALWGAVDKPRRGPKPSVTIHEIASTAMELADEGGLDAVTMAAVAGKLKLTTMALYRHVDSHRDLVAVAGDTALGRPPTRSTRAGWRRQVGDWARAEFKQLRAHPWVLEINFEGPPAGPNSIAWMDSGMQVIGSTGLGPQPAASALLVVDGFVRSMVTQAQQYGDGSGWARALSTVVTADEYPAVSTALAAGVFEDDEPFPSDQDVRFGLGLILDGIEKLVG
ncbi:TetR/AcrR family transcriptional regulator [Flexivirga alba]|uniref:TetR/AcrR family transcriptional regulator n=1 Tax=Flexivirga alba TaxID=702742 RepID=A0ABW2ALP9_9MICO